MVRQGAAPYMCTCADNVVNYEKMFTKNANSKQSKKNRKNQEKKPDTTLL